MNWDEIKESVGKEYSYIKGVPCECGGAFKPHGQALY